MKRTTYLAAIIAGSMLLVGAKGALADAADCTALFGAFGTYVGVPPADECRVSGPSNTHLSGTVALDETLHLLNGAIITVDTEHHRRRPRSHHGSGELDRRWRQEL